MTDKMNYVYMLLCRDNTLYTGWTNDLESRIASHNAGRGSKYTRARLPVRFVYCEKFKTKSEALKREIEIKKLSRKEKLELIKKDASSIGL
jgi:putative endonuclease